MPRFIVGDDLGNIKALRFDPESATQPKTLLDGVASAQSHAIQALAVGAPSDGPRLLACARADGQAFAYSLGNHDDLEPLQQWNETRYKAGERFVAVSVSDRGFYTCTSSGALRMAPHGTEDEVKPLLGALPTRLADWKLSPDQRAFAYGGDEVDISVWDVEHAFISRAAEPPQSMKKRKRNDALFPGELWRAKNVPNDSLGLRQPIRITSLTYLSSSSSTSQLLTGTGLGDVRRYDTRAARKPVADWRGIAKVGGIRVVEKGHAEHELFVSDQGSNLYSVDLRNGRVAYGYKGISGAVTSIAPASGIMVSAALDRFCRIHSTFPPSTQVGQALEKKGEVLEKVYMKSTPTVIAWDGDAAPLVSDVQEADDDDVWEGMQNVEDDDGPRSKKKRGQ